MSPVVSFTSDSLVFIRTGIRVVSPRSSERERKGKEGEVGGVCLSRWKCKWDVYLFTIKFRIVLCKILHIYIMGYLRTLYMF